MREAGVCADKACCRQGSEPHSSFARNVPLSIFIFMSLLVVIFGIVGLAVGIGPFATSFVQGSCFFDLSQACASGSFRPE